MAVRHSDLPACAAGARSFKRIHIAPVTVRPAPYLEIQVLEMHSFLMGDADDVQIFNRCEPARLPYRLFHCRVMIARQDHNRDSYLTHHVADTADQCKRHLVTIKCITAEKYEIRVNLTRGFKDLRNWRRAIAIILARGIFMVHMDI